MNWLVKLLQKEAKGRRYQPRDRVRYYTKNRGGQIVLTPHFHRGTVKEYDINTKRYVVQDNDGTEVHVHPRNIVPDSISRPDMAVENTMDSIEPFPR